MSEFIPENQTDQEAIEFGRIARILDGQHRIAGFLDDDENYALDFMQDRNFDMSVSIFIGADIPEQANIFATVNLMQTKVNRSLVYDLKGLSKSRSPQKSCHAIAVALDQSEDSPFSKRIKRLGVVTPGRVSETLTQAAFVEALVVFISANPLDDRNRQLEGHKPKLGGDEVLTKHPFRKFYLDEDDVAITEILYNYFDAVRSKWPSAWNSVTAKGNLLPRSNAFKALMRYLLKDVYNVAKTKNAIPTRDEFLKFFDHVALEDSDFTSKKFVPGSGGEAMLYRVLSGKIPASELIES